jgi:hypothetical protein
MIPDQNNGILKRVLRLPERLSAKNEMQINYVTRLTVMPSTLWDWSRRNIYDIRCCYYLVRDLFLFMRNNTWSIWRKKLQFVVDTPNAKQLNESKNRNSWNTECSSLWPTFIFLLYSNKDCKILHTLYNIMQTIWHICFTG